MTPIVLIPGLLGTAELFAPQIAALWPYGPVTVANTLEGWTLPGIAASILASAPPRFALAGISMGGYLSFEILRQAPERILKLALIDTSPLPDSPEQTTQRRAAIAYARAADFGSGPGFDKVLAIAFSSFLHPSRRQDSELIGINVAMGVRLGVDVFARQQEAIIARVDSRPILPTISCPTIILVGDSDPITPPDRSREMAATIPNARLVLIPECGHCSTLERPEAVNRALIDWITA